LRNKAYQRWTLGLLAGVLALLLACAAVVWAVDPCFYYHSPVGRQGVFFNQRYQDAGLAKNTDADTVLLGTSMVANYRVSQVEKTFGGTAVKLTVPDGYLSEFDAVMGVVWRYHDPKRVIFGLDTNILMRDESGKTDAMPKYLYDANPVNDVKYFLNKDTLYYSVYQLMSDRWGETEGIDGAFTWDNQVYWSKETALAGYRRPLIADAVQPENAFLANTEGNLKVVERWITAHPDTEFDIFFPPYSILYWDKEQRLGETDAVFAALSDAFGILLRYDNVKLYYFPADRELVTDLDNYGDYIHHSGKVCEEVLSMLAADKYRVTPENGEKILADWHDYVVHYDYESIWADAARS
jgi:hypothetical protein